METPPHGPLGATRNQSISSTEQRANNVITIQPLRFYYYINPPVSELARDLCLPLPPPHPSP